MCKTKGALAYWVIDGTALTKHHADVQDHYKEFGIAFTHNDSQEYYNLTMTVPADVRVNFSISCVARDSGHQTNASNVVIFTTFCKSEVGT